MAWPDDLLEQVDREAARRQMNRSEFVRWAVLQVLSGMPSLVIEPRPDVPAVMNVGRHNGF
jgi:hypothetical protein